MIEQINKISEIWWSWMWPMFWQVGVLIVLLGVVDLVIRKRLWPQLRYALWLLVLVKLVLPPTFSLSTSLTSQLQPLAEQVLMRQTGIGGLERDLTTAKPLVNTSIEPSVISQETGKSDVLGSADREVGIVAPAGAVKPSRHVYLMLVWLLGTLVLATWLVVKLRQLRGPHREKTEEAALPPWFGKLLADTAKKLNLRRVPEVAFSETVVCPAVFGIFRPILLLPKGNITGFSRKDTEHILLHELAHIKRGDLWVHSVYMVLQVVYWFNPLLWFVRRQLRHLRELCCDATVGRILQEKTADYRQTILENARRFLAKTVEPGMGLLGLFEDSNRLLIRLKWLEKKTWKYHHLRSATIFAVVALMLACVLPMAKAQKSDKADMPVRSGADTGERIVGKSGSANAATKPEAATTLRKLREEWEGFASLSPDGKYMCDLDSDTGDLVVRELGTGKQQSVTNKGFWEDSEEYALDSAISPDGKRVAYLWYDPNTGNSNLYTIGLDGSGRKLLRTNEYLIPRDWSPDGKRILGILLGKPKEMLWVSSSDGSIRRIKSVGKGYPGKFDVSPDGRYIAYDLPQEEGSSKRDIFLFAIDENREIPLVQQPANDKLLGWSPDGKSIFFASDMMGSWDGWLLNVAGGKPKGLPELVKSEMGDVQPIGFTPNGDYYFGIYHSRYNVYTAMLDLQTGKDLSAFKTVGYTGTENLPDWSPDGRYLAYCTGRDDDQVIRIRSLATGRERELDPNLPFFYGLRWSPDGRSLLASGFRGDEGLSQIIYKVDAQTGEHTALSQIQKGEIRRAGLSPDGRSLFYDREEGIVVKDLGTDREKEIFRAMPPMQLRDWALSPDGQRLVFGLGGTKGGTLNTISATGGEPRELLGETWAGGIREFEIRAVTWMPDSRSVLFRVKWQGEKGGGELWWISAEGGEPRKLWVSKKGFGRLRVHPDGQHIAFSQHDLIYELWVMENFLPTGVSQTK